jgi:hypothetical protein
VVDSAFSRGNVASSQITESQRRGDAARQFFVIVGLRRPPHVLSP